MSWPGTERTVPKSARHVGSSSPGCADADIPEVRQLATTDRPLVPDISAFIDTGHSNAESKGINGVIKLAAPAAFGFRNGDS